MLLFDRWGCLIFEATDFPVNDNAYSRDGKFKGEYMNPGVFVYNIEVEFIDGVVVPYKGSVTLIK